MLKSMTHKPDSTPTATASKEAKEGAERVIIGRIVGTHGVKGELKLLPNVPKAAVDDLLTTTLAGLTTLMVGETELTIKSLRSHKGIVIVKTEELKHMDEARLLVGQDAYVPRMFLPELAEGEFYEFEIIGLRVLTTDGKDLGRICSLLSTGPYDLYVVEGEYGEVLIPAVEEFLSHFDKEAGVITVDLPEGLVPEKPVPERPEDDTLDDSGRNEKE